MYSQYNFECFKQMINIEFGLYCYAFVLWILISTIFLLFDRSYLIVLVDSFIHNSISLFSISCYKIMYVVPNNKEHFDSIKTTLI